MMSSLMHLPKDWDPEQGELQKGMVIKLPFPHPQFMTSEVPGCIASSGRPPGIIYGLEATDTNASF